jgi:hypothetical protein
VKILKVKRIEGCLEGTNVRDVLLDLPVNIDFLHFLETYGKLNLKTEMKKPYYVFIVRGKYTIKGSVGNKTFRLILPQDGDYNYISEISEFIGRYTS